MASVYIRTDNVILVALLLVYLCLIADRLRLSHGMVLLFLAVGSVIVINHFAGDYGAKMLYYRIEQAPVAIGEFVPSFGIHEYFAVLKMGISGALHGQYLPFLLMGIIGMLRSRSRAIVELTAVVLVYATMHLIIYPVPEPRYFGLFFAVMVIAMCSTISITQTKREPGYIPIFE